MDKYEVTVSLTKIVEADNKDDAYKKAFDEFMDEGVNPNSFYVYINGKEY